jgi:hypothetical protein
MAHEIRMRNVPKELIKQAEQVQAFFNENTITGAFEKLLPRFFADQDTIKELQQANEALERRNEALEEREADAKNMLYQFKSMLGDIGGSLNRYAQHTGNLVARFSKPKKKKGTKKKPAKNRVSRSARPGKKKSHSPKRKGGKK